MDTRLKYLEARIDVHASRVPILIDLGAPPVLIGQEVELLSIFCAEYAIEYLAILTTRFVMCRYCKVTKSNKQKE